MIGKPLAGERRLQAVGEVVPWCLSHGVLNPQGCGSACATEQVPLRQGKAKKTLSLGTLFLLVMKISRIWVVESFYLLGFSGGMFFLNQDLGEKEFTYLHF